MSAARWTITCKTCEELFSAARSEFKHLEHFYFHNFPYEALWRDNRRRFNEHIGTVEVMRTYASDYKLIFVGDATMSPYEITHAGGSVEHWNAEPGSVWLERLMRAYPKFVWINPQPQARWRHTASIAAHPGHPRGAHVSADAGGTGRGHRGARLGKLRRVTQGHACAAARWHTEDHG